MTEHSISIGSDPQGEPGTSTRAFTDSARITGDTARITIGGAQSSGAFDNVKTTTGELMPRPDGSQGILSTARSLSGRALSGSDVKPTSLVKIGDTETTVQSAVAAGYLRRNGDGSYSDVAQAQQQDHQANQGQPGQPEAQPEAQEPARVADLPAEAHTFAQDFTSRVGNIDMERGVSEMIEQGSLSQDALAKIAGAMSLEPGEVSSRAATIQAAYRAQANEMAGPAAEQIFAWANQHDRAALRKAVDAHVKMEDPTAYDGIVRNFWMNLSPEAILGAQNAAQVNPRRESNGSISVQTKDMPSRMSWQTAVRLGYVGKPGR
jgi:hypothetical protein